MSLELTTGRSHLQHYFAEIQPILRQLPIPLFQWLKEIIAENEKDLESIHAVLPNQVRILRHWHEKCSKPI
jgi:hypothetical protein